MIELSGYTGKSASSVRDRLLAAQEMKANKPTIHKKYSIKYSVQTLVMGQGFSLIDVQQPCPSFNKEQDYAWYQQNVFDLNDIQNARAVQLVFDLLRNRVGSPISYTSIAEDVGVAPNTVKKYINLFEALFIVFRVTPYARNIARSLSKEPKIYFFDTGLVQGDEGVKFENLMALCLLKHVYAKIDYLGESWALHYLRTKDGREVDFALVKDNKVISMLEAKLSDGGPNKSLVWFQNRYNFPAIQIVKELRLEYKAGNIDIKRASLFLQELDL